jgi:hypothetical protein
MAETKTLRVLGGDITNSSIEELTKAFDKLTEDLAVKQYTATFKKEHADFFIQDFLPNIKFQGRQAFDVAEINELFGGIGENGAVTSKKEIIIAVFNYLLMHEMTGVSKIHVMKEVLLVLSSTIEVINADNQLLQDAGFELVAAQNGITPEEHRNQAQKMDVLNNDVELVETEEVK